MTAKSATHSKEEDRDKIELRLEKARIDLFGTLKKIKKEADAVEAAIEDELIALRVGLLCGR